MSATQRARSGVPLAQRSALPTLPGVPAWGAVLIAAASALLGIVIDAVRGSELTATFSVFFFLGCLAAVLAVRNRGLFTAMIQPPLILVVAVPLAYQQFTPGGGGIKDLLFNVAIPLVNRFPLMLTTTLVVLAVGAGRMYIRHQAAGVVARPARRTGERRTEPKRTAPDRRPAADVDDDRQPDEHRAEDQRSRPTRDRRPGRGTDRPADPVRPAHATGSFPTGRYPARGGHDEASEERTESFDRPQPYAGPRDRVPPHDQDRHVRPDRAPGYRHDTAPATASFPGPRPAPHAERRAQRPDPDVPVHPVPQVRYRDRDDARQDPPYRYR
ncbi:DUF6542 domain-containing protein [Rhodococcus sp. NPDC058505]|uniref:DUF6542 domain-containing protein n=1 Tax=unclassified Rhodococcus (in: high G+C Gram-positive bacteria) TaxID=192944 RepID=UPI003649170E